LRNTSIYTEALLWIRQCGIIRREIAKDGAVEAWDWRRLEETVVIKAVVLEK
jgi:hypothetical protein